MGWKTAEERKPNWERLHKIVDKLEQIKGLELQNAKEKLIAITSAMRATLEVQKNLETKNALAEQTTNITTPRGANRHSKHNQWSRVCRGDNPRCGG
jgi:hypothetical protein